MSPKSQRIDDWLEKTCGVVGECDIPTPPLSPITSSKRKRIDEMPTPLQPSKRARNDSPPEPSEDDGSVRSLRSEVPSLRSGSPSKTPKTSRSGSPSKRQRDRIAMLSTPYLEVKTPLQTVRWKQQAAVKDVPLLPELFKYLDDDVTGDEPNMQDTTRERSIVREVDQAVSGLNEDQWSDAVVLPFLQAAQARSRRRRCQRRAILSHDPCDQCEEDEVSVINVKTIGISPASLNPLSSQYGKQYNRKVDYCIGIKVASERETARILHSVPDGSLSQSTDRSLMKVALVSHIEIKVGCTAEEARAQLKTWVAAGFARQQQLYLHARAQAGEKDPSPAQLAPQVLWLWDQEKVSLWIAVVEMESDWESSTIMILDEAVFTIDVRKPETLRNLIYKMSRVMDWGHQVYVPWFRQLMGREDLNTTATTLVATGTSAIEVPAS